MPSDPTDTPEQPEGPAPKPVGAIFAPVLRTCSVCGQQAETTQRTCPNCGAWYAAVRQPPSRRDRRRMLIAGFLLVAAVTAGALLAKPAIDRSKERAAERDRVEEAQRIARARARARVEQRPHSARLGSGDPVAALAAAVQADARARAAEGSLRGPARETECEPYPATEARRQLELTPPSGRRGYLCNVTTARIRASERNPAGRLVYPFLGVIDYDQRRLTWCKGNPPPGEQAIPKLRSVVPLSPRCLVR